MRRAIVSVLIAGLAVFALAGCGGGTAATPSTTPAVSGGGAAAASKAAAVSILEFNFEPKSSTVQAGGTVTWTNNDAVTHVVKGEGWESGDLAQGDSFSHTFDTAGTFAYSCAIHPSMTGEVVVK